MPNSVVDSITRGCSPEGKASQVQERPLPYTADVPCRICRSGGSFSSTSPKAACLTRLEFDLISGVPVQSKMDQGDEV